MNQIFLGRIEHGKLILDSPDRFRVHLSRYEGQPVEVVVRKKKSQRSLQQNSYYWGVVIEILRTYFEGYTADELHQALKYKFLRTHEDSDLPAAKSTTKLSTKEFGEYIDSIVRWAGEQQPSIYIPGADEPPMFEL